MKLVTFALAADRRGARPGVLRDGRVVDLTVAWPVAD